MGNGYLGKISAIVSANTADFDSKLSKSAREVSAFARTVQNNLTSASSRAAKSLEGIYTPLQKFERSLQAAASMKLSFKGFPGMIKDLDALQQRLNSSLSKRQIDIVLKTTGMKSITEVRDALYGLKSKDIEIITRFGGLEKVNQLREQIRSSKPVIEVQANVDKAKSRVAEIGQQLKAARESGGAVAVSVQLLEKELAAAEKQASKLERKLAKAIRVEVGVDADLATLDAVAEKAERAGGLLGKLATLMEGLGKADFSAAADKMRQLESVATEITKPLEAAVAKLSGLGTNVAAAFQPALKQTQKSVEMINSTINRQGSSSGQLKDKTLESYYESVRQKADRTVSSIERLNQVAQQSGQIKTGKEFVFEQPRMNEALNRGADVGAQAAALPAEALRTNPALIQSLVEIRRLSNEAEVAYAKFLSVKDQKQPTGESQKELDAVVKKLLDAQAVAEKEIKVVLDTAEASRKATELKAKIVALKENVAFTVTGKVQNFDQARGELSRLQGDLKKLEATQRAPISRKIVALGKLVESGDINSLETVRNLIQQIEKAVGKKLRLNIEKAQAQKAADELATSLSRFKESISFTITGKVQNLEQARSELSRLQSDVDKLTEPQKIAIAPKLQDLGELVAGNQIADLEKVRTLISEIAAQASSDIKINLDAKDADAKAIELKTKINALKDAVTFTVTGKVQNFDQARGELSRLQESFRELDKSQRKPVAGNIVKLGKLIENGDVSSLETVRRLIDQIERTIGRKLKVKLSTSEAEQEAVRLKARLDSLRTQVTFSVTGKFSNASQIEAEVARISDDIQKLDATQKAAFGSRATLVIDLLGTGKVQDAAAEVEKLRSDINTQMDVDVRTDKADARLGTLDEAWAASIRGLPETETQIDEFFKRVLADIGKLEAADRIDFDPMIASIRQLIASGAPISSVADALLQLEDAQKKVNAAGKQGETIAKLSPGAARTDLEQRLEAAKKRATNPMAPAGESVEDVGREADVRSSLGKDIGDSSRQTDMLKGSITSLKSKIDTLPEPMRARFVPAIRDAEREFIRLSTAAAPVAAEIEAARQRMIHLTQDATRAGRAMNFAESFGGRGTCPARIRGVAGCVAGGADADAGNCSRASRRRVQQFEERYCRSNVGRDA